MLEKNRIRADVNATLKTFTKSEIQQKSDHIQQQLLKLEQVQRASTIALYHAKSTEVQTLLAIKQLLDINKQVALPRVENTNLVFKRISSLRDVELGTFGIMEPKLSCPEITFSSIDAMVVPCTAVDEKGIRIGSGKGFYDKILAQENHQPLLICLAFHEQLYQDLPKELHDIPMDIVITEERVIEKKHAHKIIDGKTLANKSLHKMKTIIEQEKIAITLGVILVGDNHASKLYVSMKEKACAAVGITTNLKNLPESSTQEEVLQAVNELNNNNTVTGILVQLPLPSHLDATAIVNTVDPIKDVDGLTTLNRQKLELGDNALACCTPKGILKLIEMSNIPLEGKKVCLVGNGFLVGNPLSHMLKNKHVSFNVCDKETKNTREITQQADIIITATGTPHLIKEQYVKKGAIIIDAGTAKYGNKTVGDVDFEKVINKVKKITPVPGGVGPMTIATLVENCLEAYHLQKNLRENQSLFSNIAIVTAESSWFMPYAQQFSQSLSKRGINAKFFTRYEDINTNPDVVFILSYFSIIDNKLLRKHKHNIVVHESNLPAGKGWAPLFWQILEGKNNVPVALFEATENVDAGPIYMKDTIVLDGTELHEEIRELQAKKTIEMCYNFLCNYHKLPPQKQAGKETFYPKRTPKDSELDTSKPLEELFNQLRIASNSEYPAFFEHKGHKYVLKISKYENEEL